MSSGLEGRAVARGLRLCGFYSTQEECLIIFVDDQSHPGSSVNTLPLQSLEQKVEVLCLDFYLLMSHVPYSFRLVIQCSAGPLFCSAFRQSIVSGHLDGSCCLLGSPEFLGVCEPYANPRHKVETAMAAFRELGLGFSPLRTTLSQSGLPDFGLVKAEVLLGIVARRGHYSIRD